MDFIADNWWIWLASMVLFGGLAVANHITRLRRIVTLWEVGDSMMDGLGLMVLFGFLASSSGVVLVLSIVVNIVREYA